MTKHFAGGSPTTIAELDAAALPEPHGIGWVVEQLRLGERVRRTGWNGKGMYLFYVPADMDAETLKLPYAAMSTVQNEEVPWLCSQTDLFATDWEIAT